MRDELPVRLGTSVRLLPREKSVCLDEERVPTLFFLVRSPYLAARQYEQSGEKLILV